MPRRDTPRSLDISTYTTTAGYLVLGSVLVWSRFVGISQGYASDELRTVRNYIGRGLGEILVGDYTVNNHELFSLLGWATTSIVGESAIALRVWSAVPFVTGVALVTAWLHVRASRVAALLFLFFATASPLLLDITRQARGYGLAFAAMSVLIVAALELERTGRTAYLVAFCAAGVVGTWTLPHFGIAFVATGAVLLARPALRRRVAVGLAASVFASIALYVPHLGDLVEGSRQDYANPIEPLWIITAPIDQTLLPALRWIDETLMDPNLASLAAVVALALVIGSSPLLANRITASTLGAGVLATVVVFWIARTGVAPRFFSFLLVPLLMLLSSGAAEILTRFLRTGRPAVRTFVSVAFIALVAVVSLPLIWKIARLPRESTSQVAAFVHTLAPDSTPVLAYVPYPKDLEYYVGRPLEQPRTPEQLERACQLERRMILVEEPWILRPADARCTQRTGARRYRFEQYARAGHIDVWVLPPS